jgi:hypothetical protein
MFASGIPSRREAIARSFEPCAIARSKSFPLPNRRIRQVRWINCISLLSREAPPWRPIGVCSM